MDVVIGILDFVASWLVCSFSLYQGAYHVWSSDSRLKILAAQASKQVPPTCRWTRLLPPLWAHLEKKRLRKIARMIVVDKDTENHLLDFMNRATGWFYIALAGWIRMVTSLWTLLTDVDTHTTVLLFLTLIPAATFLAYLNVRLRLNSKQSERMRRKLLEE